MEPLKKINWHGGSNIQYQCVASCKHVWSETLKANCFLHVPNSGVSIYLAVFIYVHKYVCGSSYDIRRIKPLKHCIFHASKADFLQRSNNKISIPFTNREEDVSWIWKRNLWTVVMSQHLWDHVWKDKPPFHQLFGLKDRIPSSGLCPRALGEGGLHWLAVWSRKLLWSSQNHSISLGSTIKHDWNLMESVQELFQSGTMAMWFRSSAHGGQSGSCGASPAWGHWAMTIFCREQQEPNPTNAHLSK